MTNSQFRLRAIEKRLKPKGEKENLKIFIVNKKEGKYYEKKGESRWEEIDIKKYEGTGGINVCIDSRFVHGFAPQGMGIKNENFA